MRILLTANTSWYLYNFRLKTIKTLIKAGHEVICVAPPDEWSELLESLGVTFYSIKIDAASTNPLTELKALLNAVRLLGLLKPDFVYNFTIKMNTYYGLSSQWLKVPYANNVSGLGTAFIHQSSAYRFARYLYGVSNKRARKVFFQNVEDQQLFIRNGLARADSAVLLPGSGVDVERFSFTPMSELSSGLRFLMISRLIGDKGVLEYVNAARVVKRHVPNVRFSLLGPSGISNKTAISQADIDSWRKEGIVEIIGEQPDVVPWIQNSHVLVLPSYREGMPRTVLEAAAVGRPAIVTDVPGCRQSIIAGETGWLCEVRNANHLAKVMLEVISNTQTDFEWLKSFGKRASDRVRREFSDTIVVQEYLRCLEA